MSQSQQHCLFNSLRAIYFMTTCGIQIFNTGLMKLIQSHNLQNRTQDEEKN